MSDDLELAKEVHEKAPWWSAVPVLAAGIVGVPSFIAIMAGWFIAHAVTRDLRTLEQYNLSELHQLSQMHVEDDQRWNAMRGYIADDLRAQYQTCVNAAKDNQERIECLTPQARLEEYGIAAKKK
jgi:hypothetical protein